MDTEQVKARIHKGTEKIQRSAETAAEKLANGAEALGRKVDATGSEFGDIARRLRDGTTALSEEVEKQARLHPLATFGFAFAAGLIVARALRR